MRAARNHRRRIDDSACMNAGLINRRRADDGRHARIAYVGIVMNNRRSRNVCRIGLAHDNRGRARRRQLRLQCRAREEAQGAIRCAGQRRDVTDHAIRIADQLTAKPCNEFPEADRHIGQAFQCSKAVLSGSCLPRNWLQPLATPVR